MQIKRTVEWIKSYEVWDKKIPSVTGLLSLLEFDSLQQLRSLPNFDKILKEAWARGTYVHKFIEDYNIGKIPRVIKKHSDYIKQFIKYNATKHKERQLFLEEEMIWDKVGWTIDCIEYNPETYSYIIRDWKTAGSDNVNEDLTFKYKLQLGAYARLLREKQELWGKPIDSSYSIVWEIVIFTPKSYKVIFLNHYNLEKYMYMYWDIIDYYNFRLEWYEPSELHLGEYRFIVWDTVTHEEATEAPQEEEHSLEEDLEEAPSPQEVALDNMNRQYIETLENMPEEPF